MKLQLLFKTAVATAILLFTTISQAQKEYKETFNVDDDVTVSVNTTHTNIVFETWNRDKVEVEAYIDGEKLSEAEKQDLFDNWDFTVLGNSNKVVISSKGGNGPNWISMAPSNGMPSIEGLDFLGPMMEEMIVPMISNMKIPNLPDDLMRDIGNIDFDYEEFMKDKDGYMKKFEAQMDKKFGKDFEVKMEKWGEEFAEQYNEEKGDSIAAVWERKMENWGESFGKRMEAWGARFEKEMEAKYGDDGNYSKQVITSPNGNKTIIIQGSKSTKGHKSLKGTKTIKIKMPKGAKTEIDVRHGKIQMADAVNVKATLNHSPFTANSIDGGETLINASYAPVVVNNWNNGTLYLKFVENCNIADVKAINLQANSSDVLIGNVEEEAILAGSFGNLKVTNVSNGFKNIDVLLENTDAVLHMPDVAFSFYFNGKKSTLQYPKSLQLNRTKNYNRVLARGFYKSNQATKNVTVNANYSNVKIQ